MIQIKRVYDDVDAKDGRRWLVDRLWPRGIRKEALHMEAWLRDIAPSLELCRWFAHEVSKWPDFQKRYFQELERAPGIWQPILDAARRGPVTLLYSARDTQHNNAVALKSFLDARLNKKRSHQA